MDLMDPDALSDHRDQYDGEWPVEVTGLQSSVVGKSQCGREAWSA